MSFPVADLSRAPGPSLICKIFAQKCVLLKPSAPIMAKTVIWCFSPGSVSPTHAVKCCRGLRLSLNTTADVTLKPLAFIGFISRTVWKASYLVIRCRLVSSCLNRKLTIAFHRSCLGPPWHPTFHVHFSKFEDMFWILPACHLLESNRKTRFCGRERVASSPLPQFFNSVSFIMRTMSKTTDSIDFPS